MLPEILDDTYWDCIQRPNTWRRRWNADLRQEAMDKRSTSNMSPTVPLVYMKRQ